MASSIGLLAAFVAGLISFLSPCVLPLVPGYISLISGVGVEELKSDSGQFFRKVMLNSAAFILGFSIVFITLGAISTEVGQVLAQYKSLLARIAGAVIILFGLHLTGLFQIKWLLADTRLRLASFTGVPPKSVPPMKRKSASPILCKKRFFKKTFPNYPR